jgi:hypothetical protein
MNKICEVCKKPCYANSQWDSAKWEYYYCSLNCLKHAQNEQVQKICNKYNITREQLICLLQEADDGLLEYEYWKP